MRASQPSKNWGLRGIYKYVHNLLRATFHGTFKHLGKVKKGASISCCASPCPSHATPLRGIMFFPWNYLAWPHWKNHVLLTGANTRIMCFDDTSWYIGEDNNTAPKVLETDVGDVEAATVFWPRRQIVDSGSAKTSIPTVEDEWLTSVVFNSRMTWNSKKKKKIEKFSVKSLNS